jgi:restriction endonuclease S subunit
MYVHHFLKKVKEESARQDESQQSSGYFASVKSYVFAGTSKPFYYNIGGNNFSLEELKHGLLRNNIKAPMFYMRSMSSND